MRCKALHFNDKKISSLIMKTNDPSKMQKLGRKIKKFDEKEWRKVRDDIMQKGLRAKFSQNAYLKARLLKSNDARLAESNPLDCYWSIGWHFSSPNALDPVNGVVLTY